ncbi:adenylate cyclase [Rhizobium sp. XQZ8]|uniref:CYTH domain-containing protein n=1 Tax=Rhizobium populisoli TaxID=2859785 RepID=UPI001CA4F7AD|nr:adenylate cyclase [Rhizobium populisoli]MBW6426072.1 adenylate cyclase [Rhizobium populisoli]
MKRKFLVNNDRWRGSARKTLHIADHLIARFESGKARVCFCENAATLTLKGLRRGASRSEFHVQLSRQDALSMEEEFSAGPALEKHRHEVDFGGLTWQVDEYLGPLAGLVTADVELPDEDAVPALPAWAGREITGDPTFSSGRLAELIREDPADARAFLIAAR